MRNLPEIVEVDDAHLEAVLRRVEQALDEKDTQLIRAVFASYAYVTDLVEDKNTSIKRLRQLFFGSRTEKTKTVTARAADQSGTASQDLAAAGPQSRTSETPPDAPDASDVCNHDTNDGEAAAPGHGRNGADAYQGAARIDVRHPLLHAGDSCPTCDQGTVYDKTPGVLVRISGQPPLAAKIYQVQKLRCHLCGQVFTAPTPPEAGGSKYDATAGSMIGLLKYGSGLPFNRLEGLQENLEVPLPASTQWDIVAAVAENLTPAFEELVRQAAQGDVLHNDDTTVWWRCATAARWPCSSVAPSMPARIWPMSCSIAPRSCRRPFRCAMLFPATCPRNSRRSWRIAWPMHAGGLWTCTIGFPSRVAICWKRWPWFIATTPSPRRTGYCPRRGWHFIRGRAGRRCSNSTSG
jgi:transposase